MEPDGVADSGCRPLRLNHHGITSCRLFTATVYVPVNSKQKIINNVTSLSLPAVIIAHTSTTAGDTIQYVHIHYMLLMS